MRGRRAPRGARRGGFRGGGPGFSSGHAYGSGASSGSGSGSQSRSNSTATQSPWSRLKPVELDPLDAMGLPSKGDNRLLDFKTQERYYTSIVDRYMTFCSDAGQRDELLRRFASLQLSSRQPGPSDSDLLATPSPSATSFPPSALLDPPPPTPSSAATAAPDPAAATPSTASSSLRDLSPDTKDLSAVLAALRKLREGIVASKRADDFAIQAYLFCIRLAVMVRHPESYHPAILHLLRRIHPASASSMTSVETAEVAGYLVLDTACRRNDLAAAYALRNRHRLRDPRVDRALAALAHDDYLAFARLKARADAHKARLMEYADDALRRHALKCFARAYLSVDLRFLERSAGAPWAKLTADDGVGWELQGDTVVIRKVKAR